MKVPEAGVRVFDRKWVCKKCKRVVKADATKVRAGTIICRNGKCNNKTFRAKSKEKKVKA